MTVDEVLTALAQTAHMPALHPYRIWVLYHCTLEMWPTLTALQREVAGVYSVSLFLTCCAAGA